MLIWTMDLNDIQVLAGQEATETLRAHAGADPTAFALTYKGALPGALLATQLGLRSRAAEKLPSWVAAECLFTGRALEQSSSESIAKLKFEGFSGGLAVDLTGGLGADVWAMAQGFERVVYVDANPVLCKMAQENFHRLGLENVTVVNQKAEEYVAEYEGEPVGLVYVDPDRRDTQGKRQVLLQDCSPNVLKMMSQLQQMGTDVKVVVKASPMLDVAALDAELGEMEVDRRLAVVALGNEVKELLAVVGEGEKGLDVQIMEKGNVFTFSGELGEKSMKTGFFPGEKETGWLAYEPNPAFYKARLTGALFNRKMKIEGAMNFEDGYFFSRRLQPDFPGRIFKIAATFPYKPKVLRKQLKQLGRDRLLLTRRHFDLPISEVEKKLGLKQGGEDYLLLTRQSEGQRMALLAKRLR